MGMTWQALARLADREYEVDIREYREWFARLDRSGSALRVWFEAHPSLSANEMARIADVSLRTIGRWRRTAGLPATARRPLSCRSEAPLPNRSSPPQGGGTVARSRSNTLRIAFARSPLRPHARTLAPVGDSSDSVCISARSGTLSARDILVATLPGFSRVMWCRVYRWPGAPGWRVSKSTMRSGCLVAGFTSAQIPSSSSQTTG